MTRVCFCKQRSPTGQDRDCQPKASLACPVVRPGTKRTQRMYGWRYCAPKDSDLAISGGCLGGEAKRQGERRWGREKSECCCSICEVGEPTLGAWLGDGWHLNMDPLEKTTGETLISQTINRSFNGQRSRCATQRNHALKGRMREFPTSGSVVAQGGEPPGVPRLRNFHPKSTVAHGQQGLCPATLPFAKYWHVAR